MPLFCLLTLEGRDMSLLLFLWTRWSQVSNNKSKREETKDINIRDTQIDMTSLWHGCTTGIPRGVTHSTSFGNHTSRISKPVLQVLRASSQSQSLTEISACIGDTINAVHWLWFVFLTLANISWRPTLWDSYCMQTASLMVCCLSTFSVETTQIMWQKSLLLSAGVLSLVHNMMQVVARPHDATRHVATSCDCCSE